MSGNFWRGVIYGLPVSILLWLLILWLLVGCQTPYVEFDDAQCRLLRQRGVNTTLLCRRPPGAQSQSAQSPSSGASSAPSSPGEDHRMETTLALVGLALAVVAVLLLVVLTVGA